MPMPRFQPLKDAVASPKNDPQQPKHKRDQLVPPPLPAAEMPAPLASLPTPKSAQPDGISAEAQMLLSFNAASSS
ncbi:hypothetical protein LPJ73_009377 [Coemansia sp. RSA 2703]|nr:hypothetical protein LPJ73_009377 [Coemansia sp. RSA 2703]